jgi:hypothetical protein
MRIPAFVYIIVLILALSVLYFLSRNAAVGQSQAYADGIIGTVQIKQKGASDWQALALGQQVKVDDTVRTAADAELDLRMSSNDHIRLGSNTTFQLTAATINYVIDENATRGVLSKGKVWVKTRKTRKTTQGILRIILETPSIAVLAQGNIYSLEVKSDGTTVVEGYEGSLRTRTRKATTETVISERQIVRFDKQGKASVSIPMTGAEINSWAADSKATGAFLNVVQPKEGERSAEALLVVSGYTDPGNVMQVNNQKAAVDNEGRWSVQIGLNRGENIINILATDSDGRQQAITRKVSY